MPNPQDYVRFRGQRHEVLERLRICGQSFSVLKRFGRSGRQRLYVLQKIENQYQQRAIHIVPNSTTNMKRIHNLNRAIGSSLPLPRILFFERAGHFVRVVTEWIPGESLRNYLEDVRHGKRPPISPFEAIRLHGQLARQLHTLEKQFGILHGDISADNLVISPQNHRLVLIDFGSSFRFTESRQRDLGDGMSPIYSAPEIQQGGRADIRSEQFSATMIFYELLTGTIAYDGLGGKIVKHVPPEGIILPPPSYLLADQNRSLPKILWKQIDDFVTTGLALERGDRFATKTEWLQAATSLWREAAPEAAEKIEESILSRLFRWWDNRHSESSNIC